MYSSLLIVFYLRYIFRAAKLVYSLLTEQEHKDWLKASLWWRLLDIQRAVFVRNQQKSSGFFQQQETICFYPQNPLVLQKHLQTEFLWLLLCPFRKLSLWNRMQLWPRKYFLRSRSSWSSHKFSSSFYSHNKAAWCTCCIVVITILCSDSRWQKFQCFFYPSSFYLGANSFNYNVHHSHGLFKQCSFFFLAESWSKIGWFSPTSKLETHEYKKQCVSNKIIVSMNLNNILIIVYQDTSF